MASAITDVISVPTTSGRAPNWSLFGTHASLKTKSMMPTCLNSGRDSPYRRMKKNAISARTPTAIAVSVQRRNTSGSRAAGGPAGDDRAAGGRRAARGRGGGGGLRFRLPSAQLDAIGEPLQTSPSTFAWALVLTASG